MRWHRRAEEGRSANKIRNNVISTHIVLRIMYIMLNGVRSSLKAGTAAPGKFPSLPISHPLQTIDSASTTGFLILTDGADLMGAFLK